MSSIILGCDENGNDASVRDTVAKVLREAGHTVEVLPVGPGNIQPEMMKSSSKGKISVYLQANSLETYADWEDGLKPGGYYHCKYAYFGLRGDLPNYESCREPGFHTMKLTHDNDRSDGYEQRYAGMTPKEISDKCKQYYTIVPGASAEEIGNNLVKAMNGETTDSNSKSNSSSTIKSAICDVMYNWDGEAELFLREETIYIRKIQSPSKATLSLIEGENVHLGSVTINDYNPSAVNYLTATFKDYELTIQDEYRVQRFGKVPSEVSINEEIKTLDDAKEFLQREWNKLQRDNDHSLECTVQGNAEWKQGLWCRVYLPSFNIDSYMYIINMSQNDSASDNWKCQLTLVDYPPGFGEPSVSENNSDEDTSDLDDGTDNDDGSDDGNEEDLS